MRSPARRLGELGERFGELADVLPLSPLQEGLLFHALYDEQGVDVYNVQVPLDLEGPLDRAALRRACQRLVGRHASLRAGFVLRRSGEPVAVIPREVVVPWEEQDLSGLAGERQRAALGRLLAERRAVRFDAAVPPLLRVLLVRLAEQRHVLVITGHHILWDGWSMPLVLDELVRVV